MSRNTVLGEALQSGSCEIVAESHATLSHATLSHATLNQIPSKVDPLATNNNNTSTSATISPPNNEINSASSLQTLTKQSQSNFDRSTTLITTTDSNTITENLDFDLDINNSEGIKRNGILEAIGNIGANLIDIAIMIQYETQQVSNPDYESSFKISSKFSQLDLTLMKYKESNKLYQRALGTIYNFVSNGFKNLINICDSLDKSSSDIIHKMQFGIFDYIILIPGTMFGVFGVPILAIFEWKWQSFTNNYNFRYIYSVLLTVTLSEIMKYIVGRVRPNPNNLGLKKLNLRKMHDSGSMPSGDTAQAGVAALTLLKHGYSPLLCFAMIPFGAFGRVYFGSHYIGDCIVGATLGCLSTMLVDYLYDSW